jgi:signal transduction histidine kinase
VISISRTPEGYGRGRRRLILAPGQAVPTAVVVLAAALGFGSQWYAHPSANLLCLVVWALVAGTGFGAAGIAVTAARRASRTGWLFLLGAILLLLAPVLFAAGRTDAANAACVAAVLVVVPLAGLGVLERRPAPRLMRAFDIAVSVTGCVAVVATLRGAIAVALVAATADAVGLICAGWLQFELTSGDDRRRLLWVILGFATTVPASFLLLVGLDPAGNGALAVGIIMALFSLALPLTTAIALLNPWVLDVREVIHRVTVLTVMFALTVSLFVGGEAAAESLTGQPATRWMQILLATAIAAGAQPMTRWIRTSMDEMLFGGRADPVNTLSRLGTRLAAGTSPSQWLETLRIALAVPGVELRHDDEVVATSGELGGTATSTTQLLAGAEHVGDLVVALPPDHLRLPPTTSAVLSLVAAPLAQAMHAARLTDELRASRGRLVLALEDERRRMRHDLHDGLGPRLTGIAYSADAAANLVRTNPDEAWHILRQLRGDAGEAIAEIRRIVYGLRPKALDELGLVGAVRQQIGQLRAADGRRLDIDIAAPADLPALPAAVEVAAYRVVVEAVTNVARHSGVAAAEIDIAVMAAAALHVTVRDRGQAPSEWTPGVGLTSMRERVEQIGGTLTVHSGHEGTTVTADIPLAAPDV